MRFSDIHRSSFAHEVCVLRPAFEVIGLTLRLGYQGESLVKSARQRVHISRNP